MENSSLFIRGQVWYWEDPIYGKKENNLEVSIGEVTMRYNRYCIIAQTTDSITRNSVLVIPCSSSINTPYDVPIPLAHLFHDNFSYAQIRLLFPVHPKYLQRYICTLPESIMKRIEAEMCKMLMPSIMNTITPEVFKEIFDCDINFKNNEPIRQSINKIDTGVRSFIKDHIVRTSNNDTISAHELKDAYDQYCIIHNIDITEDIVEFLDSFNKIANNSEYHFMDKSKYNVIEFRGIKIKGNLKLSITIDENDLINSSDTQKPGRWNDDTIEEFLNEYNSKGVEAASDKFGLKIATATNYWYKWKDKLDNDKPLNVVTKLPSTVDIQKSISKISNLIRNNLKDDEIYIWAVKYEKDVKSHLEESLFYSRIGTAIYYSLLDFLEISICNGKAYIPNINENSSYINTWHFFDKAYHDKRISTNKTGLELIKAYREHFPDNGGIDVEWIEKLYQKISSKLNLIDYGVSRICGIIQENYCNTIANND